MLPIVVTYLRGTKDVRKVAQRLTDFLHSAESEIAERDQKFLKMRTRYFLQLRSRRERREVEPCFTAQEGCIIHSRLAISALKTYLKTPRSQLINEALRNFEASVSAYEQLIRLRLRLPASTQEDLQRAA